MLDVTTNIDRRTQFIVEFTNREFDPFKDEYTGHLHRLIEIIKDVGEPLEGNIFFNHLEPNPSADLAPDFLPKRRSLALLAVMHNRIMEIGFNSGFSALLMLAANPHLTLDCIDICAHQYTRPCFEYLKSVYGDRINLYAGSSLHALPLVAMTGRDHGAIIIDGGHGISTAESDLYNVIEFGRRGSVICFDDSDFPHLRVLLDMHLLTGKLISLSDQVGYLDNFRQMFFINNK